MFSKKLNEQKLLKIIKKSKDPQTSLATELNKVNDDNLLKEIFEKSKERLVRLAIVDNITDEDMLTAFLNEKSYWDIGINPDSMKEIQEQGQGRDRALINSIKRINKQSNLYKLSKSWDSGISSCAFKLITDNNILIEIVNKDEDSQRQFDALKKITDKEFLLKTAGNREADLNLRCGAMESLSKNNIEFDHSLIKYPSDYNNMPILYWAFNMGYYTFSKILIKNGESMIFEIPQHRIFDSTFSILHKCAVDRYPEGQMKYGVEIMKLAIEKGMDKDMTTKIDGKNMSAMVIAERSDNWEICYILADLGASQEGLFPHLKNISERNDQALKFLNYIRKL